ncbi:MAG: hypothetical protein ABFD75_11200 [Smithella sp.]
MTFNDVRTAIVSTLKADTALAALKVDVRTHRGRFTLDDLKTVAARPMSILVSCLAVKKVDFQAGQIDCSCVWGAFVIAVDKPQMSRDEAALAIVTRLLMKIPGNLWGLDISAPEEIEAMNLYSGKTDEKGMVIWAITWEQEVTLQLTDLDTLDDFLKFHADWDLADPDGQYEATDDVSLPGPADI